MKLDVTDILNGRCSTLDFEYSENGGESLTAMLPAGVTVLPDGIFVDGRVSDTGGYMSLSANVTVDYSVPCDRCLDELEMPVDSYIALSVKYGAEENAEEHQEGEREIVFIPEDSAELDLSQVIYDYVCLSLPMQRVHEPGGCNPAAMKYYEAPKGSETSEAEESANPFAALKDMFK